MSEKSPRTMLSEPEVRRVLERAIQIDAQMADVISIDQLREVAREVGISEASLQAAVAESSKAPGLKQRLLRWPRAVVIGVSAAALGIITELVNRNSIGATPTDELVALLLVIASLIIALDRRRHGTQLQFQLDIHALWIGFIAAWSAVHGAGSAGHVDDLSLIWAAVSVIGGVIVGLRGVGVAGSSWRTSFAQLSRHVW